MGRDGSRKARAFLSAKPSNLASLTDTKLKLKSARRTMKIVQLLPMCFIISVCSSEVGEQDEFVELSMEFDGTTVRRFKAEDGVLDAVERRLLKIEVGISSLIETVKSMKVDWDQEKRRLSGGANPITDEMVKCVQRCKSIYLD